MQTDRDINKLAEPFKSKVKLFLDDCKQQGVNIFVTEAKRSLERQKELYASGRTKSGPILTWTLKSKHLEGMAIDIAFAGENLYPSDMKQWNKVYDIAEKYNITSLYRKHGVDKPHLEYSGTMPYNEEDLKDYKLTVNTMTPEQKQLIEAMIFQFKNAHNFGTDEMKKLVEKQVQEWKNLIK